MATEPENRIVPSSPVDMDAIRSEELAAIRTRREKVNQVPPTSAGGRTEQPQKLDTSRLSDDLCGLALSGGGIRAATFSLGLLQALHKHGLFRYVDYLSTVSGGGYIGAHLSSWIIRHRRTVGKDHFPVPAEGAHGSQGKSVRHLVYGGDYIVDGLTAANKYLIGFVLNNIAVFSWLVFLAAMVAMLWRTLDSYAVRDRLALIGLGSDLVAPFIPSVFFFLGWIGAWVLSYFKQEAEAPGTIARHLLRLTVGSVLVGGALLVGNGDVAIPWVSDAKDPSGVPKVFWMPLVFVVAILVVMIPIVKPSRLLRSATAPTGPLDKWVFTAVTSAALGGVPLILIGILGRENISGFSTFPDRGLHEAELKDFNDFCSIVVGQGKKSRAEIYKTPESWRLFEGALFQRTGGLEQEAFIAALSKIESEHGDHASDSSSLSDKFDDLAKDPKFGISDTNFDAYVQASEGNDTKLQELLKTNEGDSTGKAEQERIRQHVVESYLQFLSLRIRSLSKLERDLHNELAVRESVEEHFAEDVFQAERWQRVNLLNNSERFFDVLSFVMWNSNNEAGRYFRTFEKHRAMRHRYIDFFNANLLTSKGLSQVLRDEIEVQLRDEKEGKTAHGKEWGTTLTTMAKTGELSQSTLMSVYDRMRMNRTLLEALYPAGIRQTTDFQRRVVIDEDQWYRGYVALVALVFGVCVGLCLDINATSMHRYYKTRLATAFIVPPEKSRSLPLSMLNTTEFGAPYHIMGACISLFGKREQTGEDETLLGPCSEGRVDDPRRQDTFIMSQKFMGSSASGFVKTSDYEEWIVGEGNQIDLEEAVALSGAAVSPTQNQNLFVAFLMFCLNLRLGQWVPNPSVGTAPRLRPRFLYLLFSMWRPRETRPYAFVSDGGHNENTGVLELLKRRCRLIIVADAGHDPEHIFTDLANVVRLSRLFEGIQFVELDSPGNTNTKPNEMSLDSLALSSPAASGMKDIEGMNSSGNRLVRQHFHAVRILYPQITVATDGKQNGHAVETPTEGLLLIVKPSISGDEPLDLLEYRKNHPEFPQEPTSELVFTPTQVECYRRLGFHIGEDLCSWFHQGRTFHDGSLPESSDSPFLWSSEAFGSVKQLTDAFLGAWRESKSPKSDAKQNSRKAKEQTRSTTASN